MWRWRSFFSAYGSWKKKPTYTCSFASVWRWGLLIIARLQKKFLPSDVFYLCQAHRLLRRIHWAYHCIPGVSCTEHDENRPDQSVHVHSSKRVPRIPVLDAICRVYGSLNKNLIHIVLQKSWYAGWVGCSLLYATNRPLRPAAIPRWCSPNHDAFPPSWNPRISPRGWI